MPATVARGARPLRTVAVFHTGDDSGPARTLEPRLRELAGRGEVVSFFPWQGAATERYAQFSSAVVLGYEPLLRPRSLRGATAVAVSSSRDVVRLAAAFRRAEPSLVLCVTTVIPAALAAARLVRAPSMLYAAEIHGDRRLGFASVLLELEDRLATSVVGCSPEVARRFCSAHVVYPGISTADNSQSRASARASLNVSEDSFVVAAAGNIAHGRGQDVLVEAIDALEGDVVCLIAGEPHPRTADLRYSDALAASITRNGSGPDVRLLGYVHDTGRVYAAADVVVNPARCNEAFGRTAVEAIAARRAVVATAVGAVPNVLRDLAILVNPDDSRALAAALINVRDSPPARELLDARREQALRRFGEPAQTRRFLEIALAAAER